MKPILAADLFCGAGGASTGLLRAAKSMGVPVKLLAINHWPTAVSTHELNHPFVRHLCQDLTTVSPRKEVPSGRLNILLAGPECTHHSSAAGGRPINDQSRETAWAVVKWAQELYIDTLLIENVPEFMTWGPIGATGRPIKRLKGATFKAFITALESLDYKVDYRILVAADYGDPTTRRRLFITATKRQHPLMWPMPTHSKQGGADLFGAQQKWRAAREIIDWSRQGKSIFDRKKPLSPKTMERILAGLEKFGGPELHPFLVVLRQHMAGRSVDGPLPTIAAQGQHVALAEPIIVHATHGGRARSIDAPLPTVTGAHRGELAVVTPFVLGQQTGSVPRRTDSPLPTVSTDGAIQLVEPFLIPHYGERPTQTPRTHSVSDPVPTIPATGSGKFKLVQPMVVDTRGHEIEGRVQDGSEPLGAVTGSNRYAVTEFVITPGGADLRGGRSAAEPLPTVTGTDRFAVTEAFLTKYNGTAKSAQSIDEPMDTVTAKDRLALAQPFLVQTSERRRASVDSVEDPLRTVTAMGGRCFGLAQPEINGYRLDIRFRMLHWTELAAAMSFPADYRFKGTQEDIVKQIGNSWPGELAKALCTAALTSLTARKRRTGGAKERVA